MSLYPILSPVFTGPENSRLVVYARTQQTNILNLIEKNKLSIVIGSSATNVEKCIPLTQFLNIHDQNAKDIIMKFTDGDIDTLNKLQEKYCESLDNAKIIDIAFYSDLSKNLHYWLHFTTIILSWSVFLSWHNIGSANGLINLFTICISVFIMMLLFLLFGLSYRDSAELSFLALLLLSLLTMRYHQNLNKFRDVVDLFVSILPYTAIGFTATTMFIMTEDGWTTFVAVVLTDVILILISPLLKKYFAKSVLIHTINCNHKKSLRIL